MNEQDLQTQEWIDAYNAGKSFAQIAREAGVASSTVRRRIGKLVEIRPKKPYEHLVPEWIELYQQQGWSTNNIAEKYKVDTATVGKYLKDAGIELRYKGERQSSFEHAFEAWAVAYLNGISLREIAEAYKTYPQTVHMHVKKLVEMRSYEVANRSIRFDKPDYFSKIDSAQKAYWLGVWFGTGFTATGQGHYECVLVVGEKDKDTLERFKKEVGTDIELIEGEGYCRLRIHQKQLTLDLERLGLVKRKTENMSVPDEVMPYINSFMLGYYEGKGYYYKMNLEFFGPKQVLEVFEQVLSEIDVTGRLSLENTQIEGRPIQHYSLTITAQHRIEKAMNFLYADVKEYNEERSILTKYKNEHML